MSKKKTVRKKTAENNAAVVVEASAELAAAAKMIKPGVVTDGKLVETPDEKETEPAADEKPDAAVEKEAAVKYAFPSKSRCPRCGVLNTVAYTTRGPIQYRQCQRAVCRRKYSVTGTPV